MNLHEIPIASKTELLTFIDWITTFWAKQYALRLDGNDIFERQSVRTNDDGTIIYSATETIWTPGLWDTALTDYFRQTGIQLHRPSK